MCGDRSTRERVKRFVDLGVDHLHHIVDRFATGADRLEDFLVTLQAMCQVPIDHRIRVLDLVAVPGEHPPHPQPFQLAQGVEIGPHLLHHHRGTPDDVVPGEEDISDAKAEVVIGMTGGVQDLEVDDADLEARPVEKPDVGVERGTGSVSDRGDADVRRQRVGHGSVIAVGVGDQHRLESSGSDDLHDRPGVGGVNRTGIDHRDRAGAVVEHPGVGPWAGERPRVVGQDAIDPQCRLPSSSRPRGRILWRNWHTSAVAEPNPYRALPAVDELALRLGESLPHAVRVDIARVVLGEARTEMSAGRYVDVAGLGLTLAAEVERSADRGVINATGVLLHTNLGRAPWSERALTRAREAAAGYSNLELDLGTGERGRRGGYVTALLRSLSGAEDALVVNNNASALLLTLAALARGSSVPVARGELIEIGGSYRLPEVMAASGARLVEVGTTNRTRVGDYRTALQLHHCAAILKVHPSNYRIEGFVEEAELAHLATLAAESDIPLVYDLGSGLLDDRAPWIEGEIPKWVTREPAVRQSLEAGADLVLFSGDKLLGGPQAGVVVGSGRLIEQLRSDPLSRALRPDAVTLAALAATLEAYATGTVEEIPFWRMALIPFETLEERARRIVDRVGGVVKPGHSAIGAGSAPGTTIPSPTIVLEEGDRRFRCLLQSSPSIVARREEGKLLIDLRCVDEGDDETLADALLRCL